MKRLESVIKSSGIAVRNSWNATVNAIQRSSIVTAIKDSWAVKAWKSLGVALVMALALQGCEYVGSFGNVQGYALNLYRRLLPEPEVRIVTISIDEKAWLSHFGKKSPLDPNAVRSLVAAVQQLGPAAVGVDLLTDEGYENAESQNPWPDPHTRVSVERPAPIVWAAGALDSRVEYAPFHLRLIGKEHDRLVATPDRVLSRNPSELLGWGLAIYLHDDDGVVRRLPREWYLDAHNAFENTFARQVARAYCRATNDDACDDSESAHEVFLPFNDAMSRESDTLTRANDWTVTTLFECRDQKGGACVEWELREAVKNDLADKKISMGSPTVVIIGANYPLMTDWHRTPMDERTPGLWINASAVQAEISGPRFQPSSHLFSFLLDLLVGFLIVWVFTTQKELGMRKQIGMCVRLALLTVLAGFVLFTLAEMLWVSWVGMLMTGLAWHIVVEVLHHPDPPHGGSKPSGLGTTNISPPLAGQERQDAEKT